jgi:glycosyltransferase involved in cell wall biosynthesis
MSENVSAFPSTRVSLVTGGLGLGGATTFLCNLGGELVRRRIPVEIYSLESTNTLGSDFERLRVPVLCQDDRRLILEDRLSRILSELCRFRPTAVIATLGAVSFEVLRYVPSGVFRMGMVQADDPNVYRMVRFYREHLDGMAAVSRTIQKKLGAMPEFENVPVHYLPYGVPMGESPANCPAARQGRLRILYLGRLAREQKRVQLFPGILAQLIASGIPFHWTIAGEGPEEGFLRTSMVTPSPEQTVSFPGRIEYGAVPQLLSQHDIFLLASDYEGLPLSLLEAMGCGLVPVVSDLTSGIPEVVDESTGRRVPTDDAAGYGRAILELHRNRERLERLSENAQAKVRREFSVSSMTERWLGVLPEHALPNVDWPGSWRIRAPLEQPDRIAFTAPGRLIRRCLRKLRR